MRLAPPVLVLVGRSCFGVAALAWAWLAGLAVLLAWAWQVPASRGGHGAMGALLVCCGIWAWHSVRQGPAGLLDWNGSTWLWQTARGDCDVQLCVACDLQRWVLVRIAPRDGSAIQWVWLASAGAPEGASHWRAVRRALYCRDGSQAPPERPAALS